MGRRKLWHATVVNAGQAWGQTRFKWDSVPTAAPRSMLLPLITTQAIPAPTTQPWRRWATLRLHRNRNAAGSPRTALSARGSDDRRGRANDSASRPYGCLLSYWQW